MKNFVFKTLWNISAFYLQQRGAKLGNGVRCNGFPFVKIKPGGELLIAEGVNINSARWSNAHIVAGSMNIFVGSEASLTIGENSGISGTRLVSYENIEIGKDCMIGAGCLICDSDMHEVPLGSTRGIRTAPIKIGDRAFIGAGSTILKGVNIGEGAVIGAGSVVSKDVPANSLAAGNPATILHNYTQA